MSEGGPSEAYYRAIEETFNRRRAAPLLLSPRDWALIGEWERLGVPLRIVLQGIESCFDGFERRRPNARRINSLSYCRQEVLGLHDLYLGLHGAEAGRPEAGDASHAGIETAQAVTRHLTRLTRAVRESMTHASEEHLDPLVGALAETVAALKRLKKDCLAAPIDPDQLERTLQDLDNRLALAARGALPADEVSRIDRLAEQAVEPGRGRMTPEALTGTQRAAAVRLLRQRCRLPRLTLFDS